MDIYYKYNSGGKKFTQIHTKHLTATIDAFTGKSEFTYMDTGSCQNVKVNLGKSVSLEWRVFTF